MATDPRTGDEIQNVANCHLIPEWAGVSNLTVPLDEETDNTMGSTCDVQLQKYVEVMLGQ